MFAIYLKGLALGASLLVIIGLQNAFILRQGLERRHVFATALAAGLCDALLIGLGIFGFGSLMAALPWLETVLRYGGAAFLFVYGARSLLAARHPQTLDSRTGADAPSLKATLLVLLGVSLLNPHVYLDTVVLVGGLSASYGDPGRYWFGAGAISASFLWFFSLAYGARLAAPVFAKPVAWQILDLVIGVVMWLIAGSLLLHD